METGLDNFLFYSIFTIFISYCAAWLLSCYYPNSRNRNVFILILIAIPTLVTIASISFNLYRQFFTVIIDYSTFEIFLLANFLLLIGGIFHNFQERYMLVSHLISGPLHICFISTVNIMKLLVLLRPFLTYKERTRSPFVGLLWVPH